MKAATYACNYCGRERYLTYSGAADINAIPTAISQGWRCCIPEPDDDCYDYTDHTLTKLEDAVYAVQVHTNDRVRPTNPEPVGVLYAENIESMARKISEAYGAEDVAIWMTKNARTVESWIEQDSTQTYFCGDNGGLRFDVQLADGKAGR